MISPHLSIRYVRTNATAISRSVAGVTAGLYFLLDGKAIVYVGRAAYVQGRIIQHRSKGRIAFDRYCIIPCACKRSQCEQERQAIRQFRPPFNKQYSPDYQLH